MGNEMIGQQNNFFISTMSKTLLLNLQVKFTNLFLLFIDHRIFTSHRELL